MSENRITIACWNCPEEFSKLVLKEERKGVLLLSCPFCGAESKIEFEVNNMVDIFKSKKR